jgi:ABC-2 type transport system ATP-binding protein
MTAAAATTPVIELHGLEVRFGARQILKGLNCALNGRAVGLLGPNGAGKSTLINTLLGFYPPSAGTARVFGYDIHHHLREIRSLVGYVPENDSFVGGMSAVRSVRLMAELSGLPPRAALERAHEALFYVGLGEARYRDVATYSLGMKQLAKLAQAIVHGPRLLVLDEPTNGLDAPARQRMIRMVKEMRDSGHVRLLVCSHLLRDVEEICDEVLILRDGRIVNYSNLDEERRANRRFLEIEARGDAAAFVDGVEALGCECAVSPSGRIKVVLPPALDTRDIYGVAAACDVLIQRLSYRRDSLEDIFLRAMESPIATAAAAPAPPDPAAPASKEASPSGRL